nr:hypothetical protein [Tanacetum cinerariifolium]
CSWCGGPYNGGNCRRCTNVSFKDEFVHNPDPISNDETPDFSYPLSQPQTYSCELCGNDHHCGSDCQPRFSRQDLNMKLISDELMIEQRNELLKAIQSMFEEYRRREHAAQISTPSWKCLVFYDDDDEYSIQYKEYLENSSNAITPDLPTKKLDNSLIMGDKHLDTILETESDKVIKSSVENLVPIPSESEDTSGSDSECVLPSCDDFSSNNVFEEKSVTFSNPLFNLNDDFTSIDDESLSDEDVSEDNVKIYSNPLFELDDEYISSNVNPLFDEVLEDIECKDSYDSNLDD